MKKNVEKVKQEWTEDAQRYALVHHNDKVINEIVKNPKSVFRKMDWEVINSNITSFDGLEICVPSSGNNKAVFAFALMGAKVTSCDITEKQLENATKVADRLNLDIDFVCSDTMELSNIDSNKFDYVYTSNGVHVWIDDLGSMYKNICRILKKDGIYSMFEIHPFTRPFKDDTTKIEIEKRYDDIGPFNDGKTHHWRVQDIINTIIGSGLNITRIEETLTKDYTDWTNWWNDVELTDLEIKRLEDYRTNPLAALPLFMILSARK